MISGPHQFSAAACELVFAAFKKGRINPNGHVMSKSK